MKIFTGREIRNVAVVGHGGAGKTSLVSAMLFDAGLTPRLGRVDDGTTVTDYDEDEIERKNSLHTSLAHLEWKGIKINLLDTPGTGPFIHDARAALRVADLALFLVDAVDGVQVQTESVWALADDLELPRMIVISKVDRERSNAQAAMASLKEAFGRVPLPLQLPMGSEREFTGVVDVLTRKAYSFSADGSGKMTEEPVPDHMQAEVDAAREALTELVAENSDELMEKFFAEGTLSEEEMLGGVGIALRERKLAPVFFSSGILNIGVPPILDAIVTEAPSPIDAGEVAGRLGPNEDSPEIKRPIADDQPYSAFVFKTLADPFAGRITLFKVCSGVIKSDMPVFNATRNAQERLGPTHIVQGKTLEKIAELHSGDIGAVTKLRETFTNDTFADKTHPIFYPPVKYPTPAIAFAVEPKSRGDEDKLSIAIHKLLEEDLALRFDRDPQTKDFLLSGTGQSHIEVVVNRLKKRYGVEVTLKLPKVPYRETIRKRVESHGRHKKQTGGRGQFGDATCVFEPLPRGGGYEWVDKIFGGVIPQNLRPAVEKGIVEAAHTGPLAGYPVVDFRVELIDGSVHPVDSDELSFKLAGRKSFRQAMEQANPVLLEPVMNVEVVTPQDFAGDIMGDLNSRRGRIQGMDSRGKQQVIKGKVPLAELLTYQSTLNSITGARASYTMGFDHYDEVPALIAQKIIAEAKAEGRIKADEE
ncbi:MAG: elongation factor G [Acidobacteria bacterium]|nr:elongation factor G [Acidobacteriota bacterium]